MAEKKHSEKTKSSRFFKSRKDRMIDGVCGGLAEYLGADVTLVRILWLVSVFLKGLGLIAYFLAMIIVPVNPEHKNLKEEEKTKRNPALIWGGILIIFGLLLLFQQWDFPLDWDFPMIFPFYPWWHIPWGTLWPLSFIILGIAYIAFILKKDKKEERGKSVEKGGMAGRLCRTPDDKLLGGVCGGIGRHWNIDPTLVRICFVVLALMTNLLVWIVLYIALLFVLPQETVEGTPYQK
jgi:phage shock protein PspC (stress-responsive transcriptional regulator)